MFKENVLTKVCKTLKNDSIVDLEIPNISKIFSYIVYHNNGEFEIQYNISQTNKYNTIKMCEVINNITDAINKYDGLKKVVIYKQPSLELLLKLYKGLIIKLSKEQKQSWQFLELDDLIQMCSLVICDLYYKGYYIHKNLIRRAFINYVLLHIKKERNKPLIVSLEQEYSKKDDDDKVTIADMIPDKQQLYAEIDSDNEEVQRKILQEVKDIVVDFIGIRQYDQLLREYTNKQTTEWSRKLMQRIKAHLFELGISKKSFYKYYN